MAVTINDLGSRVEFVRNGEVFAVATQSSQWVDQWVVQARDLEDDSSAFPTRPFSGEEIRNLSWIRIWGDEIEGKLSALCRCFSIILNDAHKAFKVTEEPRIPRELYDALASIERVLAENG